MGEVPDSPEAIGRRIHTLRVALGYEDNQGGFAIYLGITAPALANYEAGDRRPSIDQLAKITSRTGATYEWLLHGDERNLPTRLAELIRGVLSQTEQRA